MKNRSLSEARQTPAWLWLAGGLFLAIITAILVVSVRRPEPPVFVLSHLAPRDAPTELAGPDTVTLDARSDDVWVLFDLERRTVTSESSSWDLGVKRHRLVVNGGEGFQGQGGVMLVESPFDRVGEAPTGEYETSRVTPGGDTLTAALDDWYAYGFFSHLLEPRPASAFILRTSEGSYAKFRILSYYCPGPEPGCLTLEFVLQGDGSRGFARTE